jgi:hypothetical protein
LPEERQRYDRNHGLIALDPVRNHNGRCQRQAAERRLLRTNKLIRALQRRDVELLLRLEVIEDQSLRQSDALSDVLDARRRVSFLSELDGRCVEKRNLRAFSAVDDPQRSAVSDNFLPAIDSIFPIHLPFDARINDSAAS